MTDINPTEEDNDRHPNDRDVCKDAREIVATFGPVREADGLYRYKWDTSFGRHTIYHHVMNGIIQGDRERDNSPMSLFIGRDFREFTVARQLHRWRFKTDDLELARTIPAEQQEKEVHSDVE